VHLGIAHHFGWAVAVVASADHTVVERRRLELIEPGLPAAPIHHEGGPHLMHRGADPMDDEALSALVAKVRASVKRQASRGLDDLAGSLPEPIVAASVRSWPADSPKDITVLRRVPYESRADSIMYCEVLAELASDRGWALHFYDARAVEKQANLALGERAQAVFAAARSAWAPPWTKDHRMALAATIVAP
jgi:hypothetical protein